MDTFTHTAIAVGSIAIAYYWGRFVGRVQGRNDFMIGLMNVCNMHSMTVDFDTGEAFFIDEHGHRRELPNDRL